VDADTLDRVAPLKQGIRRLLFGSVFKGAPGKGDAIAFGRGPARLGPHFFTTSGSGLDVRLAKCREQSQFLSWAQVNDRFWQWVRPSDSLVSPCHGGPECISSTVSHGVLRQGIDRCR
jgi:hypothetical protein